jgi:hypothetical protein
LVLRQKAVWFLVLWPALFSQCHEGIYDSSRSIPAERTTRTSFLSRAADPIWRTISKGTLTESARRFSELKRDLAVQAGKLPKTLALPSGIQENNEGDVALLGTYGKPPKILVDVELGSILPHPKEPPLRFSWYRTAQEARGLAQEVESLEQGWSKWLSWSETERLNSYPELAGKFEAVHQKLVRVASLSRYLDTWRKAPPESLEGQKSAERVVRPDYLPHDLKPWAGQTVWLPIVTDIEDAKFLKEVDEALEIHWNRSPWAKRIRIRFQIHWRKAPQDLAFAMGAISLNQRLTKFPAGPAVITTGGLTTHVHGRHLILGPGRITRRVLAHELGHLMGFGDCYSRSLESEGPFGVALLEWTNPRFPDELMCNDRIGVVNQVTW